MRQLKSTGMALALVGTLAIFVPWAAAEELEASAGETFILGDQVCEADVAVEVLSDVAAQPKAVNSCATFFCRTSAQCTEVCGDLAKCRRSAGQTFGHCIFL